VRPPAVIALDTYPLSATSHRVFGKPRSSDATTLCQAWVERCVAAGHRIVVPAIAYYEVLREMERRGALGRIARMHGFAHGYHDRYLPITNSDLILAAKFWAQARNSGTPNASVDALDADAILAAQVRRLGLPDNEIIVATTNVRHLAPFVPAALWSDLEP
jgi:hypothetical protein